MSRTETTLMIKLPMVTRPAMPRDWESRTASGPDFTSVPCISAGDRALVETGLHLCRMPSLTGQDCDRVLRDFSLLLPDSGGIKPPHQELTVPDAPNPGRSHRAVGLRNGDHS